MLGIDLEKADRGDGSDLKLLASDVGRALSQLVLRTDVSGMPLEWIDYKEAARLYHQEQVAYTCGSLVYRLYGGVNARSGNRTVVEVNSIVATVGHTGNPGNTRNDYVPPLNNETLFRRDAYLCLYCGGRFHSRELSKSPGSITAPPAPPRIRFENVSKRKSLFAVSGPWQVKQCCRKMACTCSS